jgi:SAM-dependent methyltransferase
MPDVHGIVADARAIPLVSARFNIVTSQFGIEYAGLDAIDEILRLIAPGGRLAMLVHHRSGGIYRQCAASLDAVQQMLASGLIAGSIDMLEAGFDALRGGLRDEYEKKARALVPALRTVESILQRHGQQVADGAVLQLYKDIRDISNRLAHYEPDEVLQWLRHMEDEVRAYAGRMASMCDAAFDSDTFSQLCDQIRASGFGIVRSEPLTVADRDIPLAWILVAARP